jgi:nucleotide-binding universal stress UspA family protein
MRLTTAIPLETATAGGLQRGRPKLEAVVVTRFRQILVPVDFEGPSQEALEVAVDLALTFDAKLTVIHAWEVPVAAYAAMRYVPPDVWTAIEQAATAQLKSTVEHVHKRLPRAESILAKGPAAHEIVAAAARIKADLIVMGTHGRRGMSHVLLGSVAEKIVRLSPVPVLTIRSKDRGQA